MIRIVFKNLDRSEFLQKASLERMESLLEKFPDLRDSQLQVTIEMENSPLQAGPDQFTVKLRVSGGRYSGVTVSKSEPDPYVALAELSEHMLEKLNRFGDRARVKRLTKERALKQRGPHLLEEI